MDKWYNDGDTLMKRCPLCQKDRGYNKTHLLYGIDELISVVGMLRPAGSQPSGSQPSGSRSGSRPSAIPPPPIEIDIDLDATDVSSN